mmetsp:Transcript_29254/g.64345  ORF Transcript_29254/g.64345 Transcript_29254/m.64345 type:complete len:83 (+) Transcript_29254:149-397(+)
MEQIQKQKKIDHPDQFELQQNPQEAETLMLHCGHHILDDGHTAHSDTHKCNICMLNLLTHVELHFDTNLSLNILKFLEAFKV